MSPLQDTPATVIVELALKRKAVSNRNSVGIEKAAMRRL
jgi:hypothetical protein